MTKAKSTISKALSLLLCLMLVISAISGLFSVIAEEATTDSPYGTATDGITKTAGNELNSIYVNSEEMTTDFSEGLKYWGPKGSLTGKASDYASVQDGVLTVGFSKLTDEQGNSLAKNYDGLQSVRMYIPEEAKGKEISFMAEVKRTTQLGVKFCTNGGKSAAYSYSKTTSAEDWYPVSSKVLPNDTDTSMWIELQVTTVADKIADSFQIRNLHIGYINDEGIFTEFNSRELWNNANGYNTPYYGTVENGIYTKDGKGVAGQDLVPLANLTNADFSEGLKYWSAYNINGSAYASDVAKVENGQLVMTAKADGNSYYNIMSAGVKIPEGLVGKMLGVAFYVDSPNNQFSVGFKTDAGTEKNGSSFTARSACRTRADGSSRGYTVTENDKIVYITFKQFNDRDTSRSGVTKIDDIVLYWYDPANTTVGYTFDGQRVTLEQGYGNVNYYTYGTEEKGIYVVNNNENQDEIPALNEFNNMDFSEGLKYWGGPTNLKGYASDYASIANGILTLTSNGSTASVTSAPVNVKDEWIGKTMHIFLSVRTDSTDVGYGIQVFANNLSTSRYSWSSGSDVKGSASFVSKHLEFKFENGDETFLLCHKVGTNKDGAHIQLAQTVFALENADGTFTTIYGEVLNQYGYPIYGTEKDGIYSGTAQGVMGQTTPYLAKPMNFNFSEGLKYWSSYNVKNTFASDTAKVENGELVITATNEEVETSYYNVMSAGVAIPDTMVGKKIGVFFTVDSPDAKIGATVHTDIGNSGYTFSERSFQRTGLSLDKAYTVTAADKVVYVRFQQSGTAGAVTKIDDVILYCYDEETETYCDFNGEPLTVTDSAYYYTYGSEEKGIYSPKNGTAKKLILDEASNFDFSEGLKYWGPKTDKKDYASDYAIAENGMLKITNKGGADANNTNGVCSVSFKLPEVARGKALSVNCDLSGNVGISFKLHTNSQSTSSWVKVAANVAKGNVTTGTVLTTTADDTSICLEMQLNGASGADGSNYICVDNISICFIDDGGIENLYASLEGAPIGYDYGDANADTKVDVRDLVRAKKYLAGISTPIYKAAANADKDSNMSVGATDLTAIAKIILGVN